MNCFSISCWTYFPFSETWDTLAQDYYDLGLNNPMTPVFRDGDEPEKMIALLDQFHALGMKVIMYDDRVTAYAVKGTGITEAEYRVLFQKSLDQFGSHPALSGFYVGDEPDAIDSELFFMCARVQREMEPNLVPFLNLLPWDLELGFVGKLLGISEYAPYLERAVVEGNLAQIGYDCYTQMWDGDSGYDIYFNNLREMRDVSNRHGIPFCSTLLSSGHWEYACPDQDDFRWQISTAVALGAKAITYFYVAGINCGENYRRFPIDHFHERTEAFKWLAYENKFFEARYGELLLQLTCDKSEFTLKAYGGLELFTPDETLLGAKNKKDINMLISTFHGEDGTKYRVVVNMDRKKNIEAKLLFAPGVKVTRLSWDNTWADCSGYFDAVGAQSLDGSSVAMWMAPGQMEILKEEIKA